MLFTTAAFALAFLPLTWAGFVVLGARSPTAAAAWLFGASLVFYGWWIPQFTLLLAASIAVNFAVGTRIGQTAGTPVATRWLVGGVGFDLALLAYFKYANFFVDSLNAVTGTELDIGRVVLPIGISFYTFTQIAFLADAWKGKVRETRFVHYGLFVTYFPHLVAGPVLHHAQMMPQFALAQTWRVQTPNVAAGLAIFALGLLKKVVLADGVAPYADAVFDGADSGVLPSTGEAWLGALAYTLQLYFDFSGYSDMAIGLSLLFNVRLPFNFDSPYRATSIADFWRRWHISLSNFLRDYLYIALGGNRHGSVRRYVNLATTMVLGGLWHGASWTFVFWGALHGAYLMVNHAWHRVAGPARSRGSAVAGWALTMLAVVVAWVFFRASSFEGAWRILDAMTGADATPRLLANAGLNPGTGALWCAVLGALVTLAPNSNVIGWRWVEIARSASVQRHLMLGAALTMALFLVLLNTARDSVSAFIYFNF